MHLLFLGLKRNSYLDRLPYIYSTSVLVNISCFVRLSSSIYDPQYTAVLFY
jgi:hypothetical protein